MAYDEHLAERIERELWRKKVAFQPKKMMGGLAFMVDDKMCVGIVKDQLMARIAPEAYEDALKRPGCSQMTFTGKPMKNFVFVDPEALDTDDDLAHWVGLCLDFNPRAKSSKKK